MLFCSFTLRSPTDILHNVDRATADCGWSKRLDGLWWMLGSRSGVQMDRLFRLRVETCDQRLFVLVFVAGTCDEDDYYVRVWYWIYAPHCWWCCCECRRERSELPTCVDTVWCHKESPCFHGCWLLGITNAVHRTLYSSKNTVTVTPEHFPSIHPSQRLHIFLFHLSFYHFPPSQKNKTQSCECDCKPPELKVDINISGGFSVSLNASLRQMSLHRASRGDFQWKAVNLLLLPGWIMVDNSRRRQELMQWHLKLLLFHILPGANGALQFSCSALFSVRGELAAAASATTRDFTASRRR